MSVLFALYSIDSLASVSYFLHIPRKKQRAAEDHDDDDMGVFIMELSAPVNDFAFRRVESPYSNANRFRETEDWTPDRVAGRATRHYVYATIGELRELVGHLCHIDALLASMVSPEENAFKKMKLEAPTPKAENSLIDAVLSYSSTPTARAVQETISDVEMKSDKATLTVTEVNNLFITQGLATKANIRGVNLCLRAAVLNGHFKVTEATTEDTVLYSGHCVCCGRTLSVTWGEALFQTCYAGLDYEDGGESAAIQCRSGECGGNYITGLCEGRPSFDSGKFHNHCGECPEFGQCIHDYRNAHCRNCNEHFFQGLSGFQCQNCGNGKANKLVQNSAPPPVSAWNGEIGGPERTLGDVISSIGTADGFSALLNAVLQSLAESISE